MCSSKRKDSLKNILDFFKEKKNKETIQICDIPSQT